MAIRPEKPLKTRLQITELLQQKVRQAKTDLQALLATPLHQSIAEDLGAVVELDHDVYLMLLTAPFTAEREYITAHADIKKLAACNFGAKSFGRIDLGLITNRAPLVSIYLSNDRKEGKHVNCSTR